MAAAVRTYFQISTHLLMDMFRGWPRARAGRGETASARALLAHAVACFVREMSGPRRSEGRTARLRGERRPAKRNCQLGKARRERCRRQPQTSEAQAPQH